MQGLEENLEKQKALNLKTWRDIATQSLIQLFEKCIEYLPTKIIPKRVIIQNHYSKTELSGLFQLVNIILFGANRVISYLNLEEEIKEIYLERMFNLTVSLRDMIGDFIEDEDCPIFLRIYASEKFPKEVYSNIRGKPIFKGQIQILLRGKIEFQRISILQVQRISILEVQPFYKYITSSVLIFLPENFFQ